MHTRMYRERVAEQWAAWVDRHLAKRHWTAKDAADAVGVVATTIGRWKKGGTSVHPENLRRLAEVLGVPPLEAYVAVGWLTPEEAGTPPVPAPLLAEVETDALLDELRDRYRKQEEQLRRARNASHGGITDADVPKPGKPEEPPVAK